MYNIRYYDSKVIAIDIITTNNPPGAHSIFDTQYLGRERSVDISELVDFYSRFREV